MNSTDLPVTEWWDPEWDVYSVPGSPYDYEDEMPGQEAPAFDVWWAAYDHVSEIEYIMTGQRWYAPPNLYQHQLTAGADGCLRPSDSVAKPDTPACTCRYGLYKVTDAPGPWIPVQRPGIRRREFLTAAFRIDPRCTHHGEAHRSEHRQSENVRACTQPASNHGDGRGCDDEHCPRHGELYEYVLDEDERRGF